MPSKTKKSMLFFHSWRKALKKLGPKQAGMVLINLLDVDAGEDPSYDLSAYPKAEGVFDVLNDFSEEKREHYADVCEKRREAGIKGQEAIANKSKQMPANADDRIGKDRIGKDRIDKIVKNNGKSKNKFKNFDEREYSDEAMREIENQLFS